MYVILCKLNHFIIPCKFKCQRSFHENRGVENVKPSSYGSTDAWRNVYFSILTCVSMLTSSAISNSIPFAEQNKHQFPNRADIAGKYTLDNYWIITNRPHTKGSQNTLLEWNSSVTSQSYYDSACWSLFIEVTQ